MTIWTLANNIIIPNMKQNDHTVGEKWAFPNFNIKPRPLINMHDIITKNNRAHHCTMGYLSATYDINPMCRSGDFVFTSSTWQNHIKPRQLCILMIFNVFYTMVIWTLANNIIIPNMKENGQTVVEKWAFPNFNIKPRPLINMHDIITKNNWAHLRTVGYLCTTYDINPMCSSGDLVFTSSTWQNHIKPHPLRILTILNVFMPWPSGH